MEVTGSRTTSQTRATFDLVPSTLDSTVRYVVFPRTGAENLDLPLDAATRVGSFTRAVAEILESVLTTSRQVNTSRLGAETLQASEGATRSLTVTRLGTEVLGVGDSAARSALLTRVAREIVSTDLATSRSVSASRIANEVILTQDTPRSLVIVRRSAFEVVSSMIDTAQRTRFYLNPTQRFPHPYDLDLSSTPILFMTSNGERTMEMTLSSETGILVVTDLDPVYETETDSGLAIAMTLTTTEE